MAGRQFDALVLHHQFTAFVLVRLAEKQGGRQVGTNTMRRARHAEYRIVDMVAVGATPGIAIEARRYHFQRQRGSHETRMLGQAGQDEIAQLLRQWIILSELLVGLDVHRLVPSRQPAILPVAACERGAALLQLFGIQHVGNAQHHVRGSPGQSPLRMILKGCSTRTEARSAVATKMKTPRERCNRGVVPLKRA